MLMRSTMMIRVEKFTWIFWNNIFINGFIWSLFPFFYFFPTLFLFLHSFSLVFLFFLLVNSLFDFMLRNFFFCTPFYYLIFIIYSWFFVYNSSHISQQLFIITFFLYFLYIIYTFIKQIFIEKHLKKLQS